MANAFDGMKDEDKDDLIESMYGTGDVTTVFSIVAGFDADYYGDLSEEKRVIEDIQRHSEEVVGSYENDD